MLPYNNEDIRWERKEEKQEEEKPALCFVGRRLCVTILVILSDTSKRPKWCAVGVAEIRQGLRYRVV